MKFNSLKKLTLAVIIIVLFLPITSQASNDNRIIDSIPTATREDKAKLPNQEDYQIISRFDNQGHSIAHKRKGGVGMIDKAGNTIVDFNYNSLMAMNATQLLATRNGKQGVINRQNQIVIPISYDMIIPLVGRGYQASLTIDKDGNEIYANFDENGKLTQAFQPKPKP